MLAALFPQLKRRRRRRQDDPSNQGAGSCDLRGELEQTRQAEEHIEALARLVRKKNDAIGFVRGVAQVVSAQRTMRRGQRSACVLTQAEAATCRCTSASA